MNQKSGSLIEYDLICFQCGYNLRTMWFGRGCPECGSPVLLSVINATQKVDNIGIGSPSTNSVYTPLFSVAAQTEYTIHTIMFLWRAYLFAVECLRHPDDPPVIPGTVFINPDDFTLIFRDYAYLQFGDKAGETLTNNHIETMNDVAKIIHSMSANRVLRKQRKRWMEEYKIIENCQPLILAN